MARVALFLCAASCLLGAAQASPVPAATFKAGTTEFARFKVAQPNGPEIDYFISKTARPSTVLLFIQGSGCVPVFYGLDTSNRVSTVFNYIPWAMRGKYAVMVVNKPHAPATPSGEPGSATGCPRQFNDYFSFDSWARHLGLALKHARQLPWVDARRTLVLGSSEGATMAAALAGSDSAITDVALVGASGPTQLYDFVLAAYKAPGSDADVSARLDQLDTTRKQIFAKPDSGSDFAWGHTFKRWSSFFRASSTVNLQKSRARIYIASGMQDVNVPILSTESMVSELQAAGRDVTVRRVANVGHSLAPDGAGPDGEYARILAWFEQEK